MPERIGRELAGHEVAHTFRLGWHDLTNGKLLDAAQEAGFELLLTADRNLRYQQNLAGRRLAIVVVSLNSLTALLRHADLLRSAVAAAEPGSYREVEIPRPALIRRPRASDG